MTTKTSTLKIKAERLGTVSEVTSFLQDLESAYNSLYTFDFLVATLANDRERNNRQVDDNLQRLSKYWGEYSNKKDLSIEPFFYALLSEEYGFRRTENLLPNLIDLQNKVNFENIVLPSERLIISKVNIQSPGFWEVMGSLNPLQQIREYLKDRHERKKDNNYKSRQEEELAELEIIERRDRIVNQRIETLKGIGYSDIEIRPMVTAMVTQPLNRLGRHQDNGQIEGADEQ